MFPFLPFESFAGAAQLVMTFFALLTMFVHFAFGWRA
jgi:hypothetical protein